MTKTLYHKKGELEKYLTDEVEKNGEVLGSITFDGVNKRVDKDGLLQMLRLSKDASRKMKKSS
jgi:hypothetical protein